jgi:ABC-2 type transport system ATP-binding protein
MMVADPYSDSLGTSSSDAVISVEGLKRRFGAKEVFRGLSLDIPRGCVLGLVGANGAGKTTLIKHLLGLLKAQEGSVRVFGLDPVYQPAEVLGRIGYLSEDHDLPGWMRVFELLRYTAGFYPNWDAVYCDHLAKVFEIDLHARVRTLSKGQQSRVGLITAIAHRPELLILDEPSSGLDPVVRRDILEAIVKSIHELGSTVLFSSHLLEEVERVADRIVMLREGEIVFGGALIDVKTRYHRWDVQFEIPLETPPQLNTIVNWSGEGKYWTGIGEGFTEHVEAEIASAHGVVLQRRPPTLEELFIACSKRTAS